jgi:hypothetical protein
MMTSDGPGQGNFTKAQEFGVENYPPVLRDILIAIGMVRKAGLRETFAHVMSVALRRLHHILVDRRLHARLPSTDASEIALQGLALRTVASYEAKAAFNSGITPSKTFHWALAAAGIDPKTYHFVDIGSGWGSVLLLAAEYPFQSVTGVEFAKEIHEKARVNLDWARSQGRFTCKDVVVRNESALETELPDGPVVIFMFNPFREPVMSAFLDRIAASMRANPRPIVLIFVNPVVGSVMARPDVIEHPQRGSKAWLLKFFSPYRVRAFSWRRIDSPGAG